jgi:hypothetical protein
VELQSNGKLIHDRAGDFGTLPFDIPLK